MEGMNRRLELITEVLANGPKIEPRDEAPERTLCPLPSRCLSFKSLLNHVLEVSTGGGGGNSS